MGNTQCKNNINLVITELGCEIPNDMNNDEEVKSKLVNINLSNNNTIKYALW